MIAGTRYFGLVASQTAPHCRDYPGSPCPRRSIGDQWYLRLARWVHCLNRNIAFGEGHKKTVQLRLDAFNALNYRGFSINGTNSFKSAYIVNAPSTADLTVAAYNAWATAWNAANPNNQAPPPGRGTSEQFDLAASRKHYRDPARSERRCSPYKFLCPASASNFAALSPNSFDIRTPTGLKDYQLRSVYHTSWATLSDPGNACYLQVSARFTF